MVGVMVKEGAENPAFVAILANAPANETPATVDGVIHNNFRPVQSLHDRSLVVDTTGG